MPKSTFLNLPEEKRGHITSIAYQEFSMNDYRKASLSRIVEKAGIAKGSVYQYFENKLDLYTYLLGEAANEKIAYFQKMYTDSGEDDFFRQLHNMMFASLRFNLNNPEKSHLLYLASREPFQSELCHLSRSLHEQAKEYTKQLIIDAMEKGQVRDDIDADLSAFIITEAAIDLEDYLAQVFDFSYEQVLAKGENKLPVSEEVLKEYTERVIDFFRKGISF
ncbi:MAG: TetR/AcrR family transcriptional regulator [Spirochaetia bacterium]